LNEQLEDMVVEAERQRDEVWALLDSVDDERFAGRPEPDRWSLGEQIAHIPLTDRPYLTAVGAALEDARARDQLSVGPFRGSWLGNWFARSMEPPVKRRMKTFAKLKPPSDLNREAVRLDFVACREELIESLRAFDNLDVDRVRIRSPFLPLLKLPAYNAFTILLAHARRHIWIAKRTFPEGLEDD